MQKVVFLFFFTSFFIASFAQQQISPTDLSFLKLKEDSLKKYAVKIIQGINSSDRFTADSLFTRVLVRALKTTNSFYFSFDSIETVSKLYAPDSLFKIFTWQLTINDEVVRQHGAIQLRTKDGSLQLFPLIDKSPQIINQTDTVSSNRSWVGAVYYNIVKTTYNEENYYTLFGYDENDISTNRKIIEVLRFKNNEPIFGGNFFSFNEDTTIKKAVSRYIIEYKKGAGPKLNYDAEMNIIVVEHLTSESNEPQKKWTLVGDGDYEGFKWKNGKWVHVEKIFDQITPEGKPPIPLPIKPDDNIDDNKKLPINNIPIKKKN